MENKTTTPMTPFDELVTSPQLQAIKLLLPYVPADSRETLAACIKIMELKQTLLLFRSGRYSLSAQTPGSPPSTREMLTQMASYLPPGTAGMLEMILNLKDIMDLAGIMQPSPSGDTSDENAFGFDPTDLLMGMLSPEQQEIFRSYSTMFQDTSEREEKYETKGEDEYGRMDQSSGNEEYGSGQTGADQNSSSADEGEGRP